MGSARPDQRQSHSSRNGIPSDVLAGSPRPPTAILCTSRCTKFSIQGKTLGAAFILACPTRNQLRVVRETLNNRSTRSPFRKRKCTLAFAFEGASNRIDDYLRGQWNLKDEILHQPAPSVDANGGIEARCRVSKRGFVGRWK